MDRVRSLYYNGNATQEKRDEQGRKAQMAHEIEIKLRVNDPGKLRAALKAMGARTVHRGTGRIHEWNTLFDTPGQELRKREQLLRTRIETLEGKVSLRKKNTPQPALLTFKGPVLGGGRRGRGSRAERHKVREEIVSTLRSQRMQASMQAIQQSATPELNEKYFADAPAAAPQGKAPSDGEAKPLAKTPESGPK